MKKEILEIPTQFAKIHLDIASPRLLYIILVLVDLV